jgi:hypothetical protein
MTMHGLTMYIVLHTKLSMHVRTQPLLHVFQRHSKLSYDDPECRWMYSGVLTSWPAKFASQ